MLQITKQGNSIVVEGLNHYFYPYNGTLEVPCNNVITVVDEGDIVLFRSASNYDVLFSAKIDEITIGGQSVTKDNVGEVFGALSNVKSGGLTPEQEEKLNNAVQISDYNADKATQTTIDEAQNTEINKLKGDIEGKQDIIQDLSAIRQGANLGKTAIQEETDPIWTADKVNYYTKSEVDTSLEAKADKTEIPIVPTNVSAFTNDAGYLTEHQSLDNYYTKTESDGKYATQVVVNEEIAARISDIRDVKATLESKADKSEIPSLNGYATEQWVGQQGYLTEHQPLKTINGETIVGDGNIEISSGEETDPVWTAEKVNYYTKSEVNASLEAKADKTEIPTVPTNVSAFTNDAGYLTEHQQLKTINGETIVGNGDIIQLVISHGISNYSGLRVITVNCSDREIKFPPSNSFVFYKKDGTIVSKYLSYDKAFGGYKLYDNDFDDFIVYWTDIPIKKGSLSLDYHINPSPFADMIQPKLTSGTDIKTINGESILGSGDIVISGGGEETDPIWNAEKVNYYTKSQVDTSLESKADKTEIPSLDNYYTKSEIDGIVGNVNNALSEIING